MIFLPLDRQYVQVESQSEGHSHAMDGFIYSFKKKKKNCGHNRTSNRLEGIHTIYSRLY